VNLGGTANEHEAHMKRIVRVLESKLFTEFDSILSATPGSLAQEMGELTNKFSQLRGDLSGLNSRCRQRRTDVDNVRVINGKKTMVDMEQALDQVVAKLEKKPAAQDTIGAPLSTCQLHCLMLLSTKVGDETVGLSSWSIRDITDTVNAMFDMKYSQQAIQQELGKLSDSTNPLLATTGESKKDARYALRQDASTSSKMPRLNNGQLQVVELMYQRVRPNK
jgi:hypothetical protein